ncbi:hypothetical protein J7M28_02500 [bacterium]|nr:hypothetical protein [bacterium]
MCSQASSTALTGLSVRDFTAFTKLDLELSPGVNVFIGANATGKTHILKLLYAAADVTRTHDPYTDKLVRVFLPSRRQLGRLVHRKQGRGKATIAVGRSGPQLKVSFSTLKRSLPVVSGAKEWGNTKMECVYIPVKEMLSNSPGFLSLHESHSIHFSEVYRDLILRASYPASRGPMDTKRKALHNKETGDIEACATNSYLEIEPNAIGDAFMDLYDRDVERALGGRRK